MKIKTTKKIFNSASGVRDGRIVNINNLRNLPLGVSIPTQLYKPYNPPPPPPHPTKGRMSIESSVPDTEPEPIPDPYVFGLLYPSINKQNN